MIDSLYKYTGVGLVQFMAFPATIKGKGPVLETINKLPLDEYFTMVNKGIIN